MSETQSTTSAVSRLSVLDLVWIYVLVMLTCLRPNRATIQPCGASLQTIKDDFHCPRNQFEWNKKAEEMKCASFSQNCTETSDFVYHCLVNAWGNGTIHVCSPSRIIFGRLCSEFNKGGARVQEHYVVNCTSCPSDYNSKESYMYQECYENIKAPTTISTEINSSSSNYQRENVTIAREKRKWRKQRREPVISTVLTLLPLTNPDQEQPVDTPDIVTPLELDLDFIEILSKTVNPEKEGTDVLKRKIHNSEFHEKYASYCLKPNLKHMSITGNWRKDLGIQTAADFFNIKIYVVVQMESGETKTYCFFPKDFDTKDWIKIAFGKEREYMLLSDSNSSNEEDASLTYDDVFVLNHYTKALNETELEEDTLEVDVQEDINLHLQHRLTSYTIPMI
ncbi:uncharacterized protein LOC125683333 isoform X2 [Ostrea edulis]|uniref:uncharacterized protein LOC125683333 isoform X2 n=1 Tax=Ostrea edulis TaxID=37623 RepID=UPI0024AFE76D|nr:uncharacterized protein LOC125683333 isoform X2 [Ostrea edulis]